MKYVKLFKELGKEDIPIAGGKGANLGELTSAGIPVPPGFVVLSTAYFAFLEHNHLRPKIHRILDSCDVSDPHQLTNASREIKKLLRGAEIPDAISREIFESYHRLSASHYKMGSNLRRWLRWLGHFRSLRPKRSWPWPLNPAQRGSWSARWRRSRPRSRPWRSALSCSRHRLRRPRLGRRRSGASPR